MKSKSVTQTLVISLALSSSFGSAFADPGTGGQQVPAQTTAQAAGTTTGGKSGTPASPNSNQGTGTTLLFTIQNNQLNTNGAVIHDFIDLTGLFGKPSAGTPAKKGTPISDPTGEMDTNTGTNAQIATAMENLTNRFNLLRVRNAPMARPVMKSAESFYSVQWKDLGQRYYDAFGQEVDERGYIMKNGKAQDGTGRVNAFLKTTTTPDSNDPSQTDTVTTTVATTELSFALLVGAGQNSNSSSGTSGGIGAGLHILFNKENSAFFIGQWISDFQFKQNHWAIGFTFK
jgi:hypothetical protein